MNAPKLVIGANGFLGSHVTRQLVADCAPQKGEVRAMVRPAANTRSIDDLPLTRFHGDVFDQRQFDRLSGYLAAAKTDAAADGGGVVVGGDCDASNLRIQPTVVVDPDPDGPLMSNEIFGPILPVVTVKSLDDAIRFVNSRPKPLSAYLFTKSRAVRERVIREVPAGGMMVNHLAFQVSTAKLPFGGVGASGMGAYHGRWGFEEFSHRKSVLTKPTRPDLSSFIYPPYTERAIKVARRLF